MCTVGHRTKGSTSAKTKCAITIAHMGVCLNYEGASFYFPTCVRACRRCLQVWHVSASIRKRVHPRLRNQIPRRHARSRMRPIKRLEMLENLVSCCSPDPLTLASLRSREPCKFRMTMADPSLPPADHPAHTHTQTKTE